MVAKASTSSEALRLQNRGATDPRFGHYQLLACPGCHLNPKAQIYQEFPVDWKSRNYKHVLIFKLG
jgi:hypothetical protein